MENKFIVNVEGCIVHGNKILMILRGDAESHAPNTLSFPGGQIELNDDDNNTIEDTLRREIFEEVGLEIKESFEYIESKKFVTKKGNNVLDIVMLCKINDIAECKIDNDEVKDCMWMEAEEILNDARTPEWIKKSIGIVKKKLDL